MVAVETVPLRGWESANPEHQVEIRQETVQVQLQQFGTAQMDLVTPKLIL
jgi:hypothetical protein